MHKIEMMAVAFVSSILGFLVVCGLFSHNVARIARDPDAAAAMLALMVVSFALGLLVVTLPLGSLLLWHVRQRNREA